MQEKFHPAMKFILAVDKAIPARGGFSEKLDEDTRLLVVDKEGNTSTFMLKELYPFINKHNQCVVKKVFTNCEDLEIPSYTDPDTENSAVELFEPVEDAPWGFDSAFIAWYKDNDNMTAIVGVPGFRLHAVKEDKSGVFLEDTNRDRIFVEYGTFAPALKFETKKDYQEYERQRKLIENYRFNAWDYVLVATPEHNYNTDGQLLRISYPDFEPMLLRYQEQGLDDETCLDEGNIKMSTPWIAFFKKPTKSGLLIVKAYLGAPGYSIKNIIPKSETAKPGLIIVDSEGEEFWVPWASWHEGLRYPTFTAFKEAKERGEIKFNRKRPYSNINKSKTRQQVADSDTKPLEATALWRLDVHNARDVDDENIMSSLKGVTPLK